MKTEDKLNRREFGRSLGSMILTVGGVGALSSMVGCSDYNNPASPSSSKPTSGTKLEVNLSQHPELQQVGGSKTFTLGSTPIRVFRTGQTSFKALSRICTHQGCTINWQNSASKFKCPCHGSEFNQSGSVIKGPASSSLQSFTTQFDSQTNILTISA